MIGWLTLIVAVLILVQVSYMGHILKLTAKYLLEMGKVIDKPPEP